MFKGFVAVMDLQFAVTCVFIILTSKTLHLLLPCFRTIFSTIAFLNWNHCSHEMDTLFEGRHDLARSSLLSLALGERGKGLKEFVWYVQTPTNQEAVTKAVHFSTAAGTCDDEARLRRSIVIYFQRNSVDEIQNALFNHAIKGHIGAHIEFKQIFSFA